MKNLIKVLTATLIVSVFFFTACEKNEIKENKLEKTKIDYKIGIQHNQMLNSFIKESENKLKNTLTVEEKIEFINNYFIENYNKDVSLTLEALVEDVYNKDLINSIPLYKNINFELLIAKSCKNKFSDYFRDQLLSLYEELESADNDFVVLKSIVANKIKHANADTYFAINEKEYFINMLLVLDSSIDFWDNNRMFNKVNPEDDYWKIPVADWIGGIAGACAGGFGAPVGYVSSSVLMWIGII